MATYLVKWIDPERDEVCVYTRGGQPARHDELKHLDYDWERDTAATKILRVKDLVFVPAPPAPAVPIEEDEE